MPTSPRTASCPLRRRRDRRGAAALIDQIEQAGLGGRGGAGFPMAKKMRTVAAGRGKPIVVVNATEGEPASLKDRTLLETLPHLVLDGAALAARAIGADEAIVCVCESAGAGHERVAQAIAEREQLPGHWPRIVLSSAPQGYVAGHESALVNHLNGGPSKPTFSPPMPFERGVRRRPTLVNNAETVAHVALIARHGPRWFRELGLADQPGSTLVTLSGPLDVSRRLRGRVRRLAFVAARRRRWDDYSRARRAVRRLRRYVGRRRLAAEDSRCQTPTWHRTVPASAPGSCCCSQSLPALWPRRRV